MTTPAAEPEPRDPLIDHLVADRYRIAELIARGGMARVYRARDERLERDVAVKVLAEPYASDPAFAERFLAEARTAAGLAHTNLVHVYDSGQDGDVRYIVMELLGRYRTLRQRLADDGRLPPAEAVELVRDVLAGLALVHDRGLVHCDVKAANVMVGPGPVKLIDFGIARTPAGSGEGSSMGSLHAMSPEQLRGEPIGPASDLYAAGVVLYEALTGRVPFAADTPPGMLAAQATPPAAASSLAAGTPRRIDDAIAQALRPDPSERFRTARAMSTALEAAMATPVGRTDETEVVAANRDPGAGYVPPLVLPHAAHAPSAGPATWAVRRHRGRGPIGPWIVAAAAIAVGLVLVFVILRPGTLGGLGGGSASPSAGATESLPADSVRVPNTVGMTEARAEEAAKAAHLNWTIRFTTVASGTPGIYDQEPAAGTIVKVGSPFVMYAHRLRD